MTSSSSASVASAMARASRKWSCSDSISARTSVAPGVAVARIGKLGRAEAPVHGRHRPLRWPRSARRGAGPRRGRRRPRPWSPAGPSCARRRCRHPGWSAPGSGGAARPRRRGHRAKGRARPRARATSPRPPPRPGARGPSSTSDGQRWRGRQGGLVMTADAVGDRVAIISCDRLEPAGEADMESSSVGTAEAAVAGIAQQGVPVGVAGTGHERPAMGPLTRARARSPSTPSAGAATPSASARRSGSAAPRPRRGERRRAPRGGRSSSWPA